MSNHGLRTTGRPNGNFGAARIQAKRDSLDLSKKTLSRDNLRIPQRDQAYQRLWEAYSVTTDPKLKAFLAETLAKRQASIQTPKVKPMEKPSSPYWDNIKQVR